MFTKLRLQMKSNYMLVLIKLIVQDAHSKFKCILAGPPPPPMCYSNCDTDTLFLASPLLLMLLV